LTDLEKALDKAKGETRGAGASLATMGDQPANIDGRPAMGFGCAAPVEVGQPSLSCQGSPCACGHGTQATHALSPRSTIRKNTSPSPHAADDGIPYSKEGDHPVCLGHQLLR
jgi:hypothetical protein